MAVRGPVEAVALVCVRKQALWEANLHVRHRPPGGRVATLPWQLVSRWALPGDAVHTLDGAEALVHYMIGEARLPGIE